MKKLSLLISTIGGALTGYLFTNKDLQTDLKKSKNASDAFRTFGKHIKSDSKKIAKDAEELLQKPAVQKKIKAAKKIASETLSKAKKEIQSLEKRGEKLFTKTEKGLKSVSSKAQKKASSAQKIIANSDVKTVKKAGAKLVKKVSAKK